MIEVGNGNGRPIEGRDVRATSIRINRASRERTELGRRQGLRANAPEAIVRMWIDDALEQLSTMPFTCALDVVEAFPDGLPPRRVGWLLGVTEQAIDSAGRDPALKDAVAELREHLGLGER